MNAAAAGRPLLTLLSAALITAGFVCTAYAEVSLTLNNSFIEKYKNRTSIEADCVVDHSKGKPNSPAKDGDMHIAVRCPQEIRLPLVAELMNAKDHLDVVDASVNAERTSQIVRITGAWRIWNEHSGDESFVQGRKVEKAKNTNPDHVFEIHPITSFDGINVLQSFKPIPGYKPKDADRAFPIYENVRSRIFVGKLTTRVVSSGVGYNYVQFQMELNEPPFKVADGSFAFARVRDWDGHLLVRKKRMVFVRDTPPEILVRNAKEDDCFRVLGMPRLDLALVSWRTQAAAKGRTEVLSWNLPYEIIVVGIYDSKCELD
jgi:hypothetical protein